VKAAVVALLACLVVGPARGQAVEAQLMVYVEPSGVASAAVLSTGGEEISLALGTDADEGPIAFKPGPVDDLPGNLTIEWNDHNSTSLPAFVFAPYSGMQIPVRVYRYNYTLADWQQAEQRCWHTRPSDVRSAFRALFGCQEWVKLLEVNGERWTRSHLKGLRGWFDGSYYLFARVRPVDGLGLSPWGLQDELVERLREIVEAVDGGRKQAREFEPFLRIADVRTALNEFDRWELRLFGVIPRLIAQGDYLGALSVNDRVRAAYARYVGPLATEAIDGVSRDNLDGNEALIRDRLSANP